MARLDEVDPPPKFGGLTNEQRSQAGWIGALKCEVVFERALRVENIGLIYDTNVVTFFMDCPGYRFFFCRCYINLFYQQKQRYYT
jgi:hypothetical protein